MNKQCTKCKVIKPLSDFPVDNTHVDRHRNECKECNASYRAALVKSRPHRYSGVKALLSHKTKGMNVLITNDEIESLYKNTTHCPICGVKLSNKSRGNTPSLDRINNENELRIDNVWIICGKCNTTKQDRTLEEFYEYCKMVVEKWPMKKI